MSGADARALAGPDERAIARALAEYHCRELAVDLGPALRLRLIEAHHAPRNSLWSRLWPSSVAMARLVLSDASGDAGGHAGLAALGLPAALPRHSLELGCGLGLVSLALAHRGVGVEATDRVAHALAFAAHNAALNGITPFATRLLDWAEPRGPSSAFIVAADVLYDPSAPARLHATLGALLQPGGTALLGVPGRRAELLDQLRVALVADRYAHRSITRVVDWEGVPEPIELHRFTRPVAP